jgi:type IV pilus assembly protein PilC
MATAVARSVKEVIFEWEGKDKNGKAVRGEIRAGGQAQASATLRRQGVLVNKISWPR